MTDYLFKVSTVWFIGFFPFFELFVAIPAGFALSLDPVSTVVFCVAGNFFPVLIIEYGYSRLMRNERLHRWLGNRFSERTYRNVEHYGIWYMLVITPWTGAWAMAVTAKVLQMRKATLIGGSLASLLIYAIVLTLLLHRGVGLLSA
jgi:uncharacterized membrane protein